MSTTKQIEWNVFFSFRDFDHMECSCHAFFGVYFQYHQNFLIQVHICKRAADDLAVGSSTMAS